MKSLHKVILIVAIIVSCSDIQNEQNTRAVASAKVDASDNKEINVKDKVIYYNEGTSSFNISSGDPSEGFDYETIETNFDLVFIAPSGGYGDLKNYLAKRTTSSKSCTGCEGQDRNIKIELIDLKEPEKSLLVINKFCDYLKLNVHTFKTIKYGCCGAEDEVEIFDYKQNSIIQSNNYVALGSIPNSSIKLYVGFKPEEGDTNYIGSLTLSYGSNEKYTVRIRSIKNTGDSCAHFSPEITLESKNERDRYFSDKHEYEFWSLNKIQNKSRINGLSIKLDFHCDESYRSKTIVIPIIDGVPFGNSNSIQELDLNFKTEPNST